VANPEIGATLGPLETEEQRDIQNKADKRKGISKRNHG
jgi:hypothetical protein